MRLAVQHVTCWVMQKAAADLIDKGYVPFIIQLQHTSSFSANITYMPDETHYITCELTL